MKTTLFIIKNDLIKKFPKNTEILWIDQDAYTSLFSEKERLSPTYIKLVCKEPLQEFCVISEAQMIHEQQSDLKGVYGLADFLPKTHLESNLPIEIEKIDIADLPISTSVTIDLPEQEVMLWSEDEIEFARTHLVTKHPMLYQGQKIRLQSGTSRSVIGKVAKIYPYSSDTEAYQLSKASIILLEGLPKNRQKTIDFDKIGGLDGLIKELRNLIQIPMSYPELLEDFGIMPPKGLLLYGPPGNGKTMIAKAIAQSLGATFISIEGPELTSKYYGEGEKRLRDKFDHASKHSNSVIFIDEIDSIASTRDSESTSESQVSIVATLLNLMDGIRTSGNIFVIGATNRLGAVDPALRRPGRFELEYEIPLPDEKARLDILRKSFLSGDSTRLDETINHSFLENISEMTYGYSGADLVSLYRLSVMNTLGKQLIFDEETKKYHQSNETQSIILKSDDVFEAMKSITPTMRRGHEREIKNVEWDQYLDFHAHKQKAEHLIQLSEKVKTKQGNLGRPSWMNWNFVGENGSGKKTFAYAVAKTFKLELIEFNAVSFFNSALNEISEELEKTLQKCKQTSPSLLYIENWEKHSLVDPFLSLLQSALSRMNAHFQIYAVLALEKEWDKAEHKIAIDGYQGFEQQFIFENIQVDEAVISTLSENLKVSKDFLYEWQGQTIPMGKLLSQLNEKQIQDGD